jgi:class 3 adenylate cyclase
MQEHEPKTDPVERPEQWQAIEQFEADLDRLEKQQAKTGLGRFFRQVRQMDFATRRVVASAALGLWAGLAKALAEKFGDQYGLAAMGITVFSLLAIINCALTRKRELGALTGAAYAFAMKFGLAAFSWMLRSPVKLSGTDIIPYTFIAAAAGFLFGTFGDRILRIRFQHDPQKRREYLLRQLIELQEELKKGEQNVTFLSVDVVGSTDMKRHADALNVEYTFNEYTHYVTGVSRSFDGMLHSTAGDGILLTFPSPKDAFLAARRVIGGMIEFNAFKNRLGHPFQVRCGIHTGSVNAVKGDIGSVNYSHVIDVTSHVQKIAPPGGIAISEDAARIAQTDGLNLGSERTEVKGIHARIWRGQVELAETKPVSGGPPPLPPGVRA